MLARAYVKHMYKCLQVRPTCNGQRLTNTNLQLSAPSAVPHSPIHFIRPVPSSFLGETELEVCRVTLVCLTYTLNSHASTYVVQLNVPIEDTLDKGNLMRTLSAAPAT